MALNTERAAGLILDAGQSDELRSALQSVAESTTPDGMPRYSTRVCRMLNRIIVCRAYAILVLQLCHLSNIGDSCGPRRGVYENLLLGPERATASGFRGWIESAVDARGWRRPGCEITREGVSIRCADGLFNLGFARMPLLAALFKFLCVSIGYTAFDDEVRVLVDSPTSDEMVRRAANGIERRIYAYLKDSLPSVQVQGKFQALLDHARSEGEPSEIVVDDSTILEFWRRNSMNEDAGNFRLFHSVFDAYMAFLSAIEFALDREAVVQARPIGTDGEAGEVDIASLLDDGLPAGAWVSPLQILQETAADRIKFLNNTEMMALDCLMEHGPRLHDLPWSVARAEVFRDVQSRIAQAMRRKADNTALADLVACDGAMSYSAWRARLQKLGEQAERSLRAALHVVLEIQASPKDGMNSLGDSNGPDELALESEMVTRQAPDDSRLEMARDTARQAFRGFSRKGFDDGAFEDPDSGDRFETAAQALSEIRSQIHAFVEVLDSHASQVSGLDGQFARDREVFKDQFSRIYGGDQ